MTAPDPAQGSRSPGSPQHRGPGQPQLTPVPRALLLELCERLGYDANRVTTITFKPSCVAVRHRPPGARIPSTTVHPVDTTIPVEEEQQH